MSALQDVIDLRLRLLRVGYTPLPNYGKAPPAYGKNNDRAGLPAGRSSR